MNKILMLIINLANGQKISDDKIKIKPEKIINPTNGMTIIFNKIPTNG